MKNLIGFFIFILIISNQLDAQSIGLDNADPSLFTKYKIPDTDLHSLWFNTGLSFYSSNNFDNSSNYNTNSSNAQLYYNLSPQYYLLQKSDERTLSLTANATGSYYYSRNIEEEPYYNLNTRNTEANLNISLDFYYEKYFNTSDFYYTLISDNYVRMFNQAGDSVNYYNPNNYNTKDQNYNLTAGIGWGRLRNVTPVVEAIRLQERLKQINAINNDLDEKTIEDAAQKFSQYSYYSEAYDRPDKVFWQDMEKTLSTDGVTLSGLNQYADSYLREVLNEVRFSREEGIQTSINFTMNYFNNYSNESFNAYELSEQLYAQLNGTLKYSHQLDLNSQIYFNLNFGGGPNVIANVQVRQNYFVNSSIGYDYELTDRLVATINDGFSLQLYDASIQGKSISDNISFVLHYFVEDHLSLTADYSWNYNNNKNIINLIEKAEGYNNSLTVGFTYYLDRGLIFN